MEQSKILKFCSLFIIIGLISAAVGLYLEYVYEVPYFGLGGGIGQGSWDPQRSMNEFTRDYYFKKDLKKAGLPIAVVGGFIAVTGIVAKRFFSKSK